MDLFDHIPLDVGPVEQVVLHIHDEITGRLSSGYHRSAIHRMRGLGGGRSVEGGGRGCGGLAHGATIDEAATNSIGDEKVA